MAFNPRYDGMAHWDMSDAEIAYYRDPLEPTREQLEREINDLHAAMVRAGLTDTERAHLRVQAEALRGARTLLRKKAV